VSHPSISIIIPTLNEEAGIQETIHRIPPRIRQREEILVVDGSSDDETVARASVLGARVLGARVLVVPRVGKGYAMHRGVQEARGELVLFIDGDSSYPSEDIPKFLAVAGPNRLVLGNAALYVLGQPTLRAKLDLLAPSFLLTQFIFWLFGVPLHDPLTGMRAIMKADYQRLHLSALTFEIETEMDIQAIAKGLHLIEIPIQITPRKGQSKFFFDFRSHLKILRLLWASRHVTTHSTGRHAQGKYMSSLS
jgi:glycosyltransferase involved in cell wall biosynthesis